MLANKDAPTCGEMERSDPGAKVWGGFFPLPFFPHSKGAKTKGESGANPSLFSNFFQIIKNLSPPRLFYFFL